jgi:hypothetical protein
MIPERRRAVPWWESVEQHVAERDVTAPDPWGDADLVQLADAALTAEQTAFLAGLDDQPAVPRLRETRNSPGDGTASAGVPSPS